MIRMPNARALGPLAFAAMRCVELYGILSSIIGCIIYYEMIYYTALASLNEPLFRGLEALGELLAARDQSYACVVAGGASLAALGVIDRVAGDVDVMAVRDENGAVVLAPGAFPRFVAVAIGFVDRRALIALKLEAASDDPPHGRTDVHLGDLVSLVATTDELDEAAQWVNTVNV